MSDPPRTALARPIRLIILIAESDHDPKLDTLMGIKFMTSLLLFAGTGLDKDGCSQRFSRDSRRGVERLSLLQNSSFQPRLHEGNSKEDFVFCANDLVDIGDYAVVTTFHGDHSHEIPAPSLLSSGALGGGQ